MSRFTKKRQIPTTFLDTQFGSGSVGSALDTTPTSFGSSSSVGRSNNVASLKTSTMTSHRPSSLHEKTRNSLTASPLSSHSNVTMYTDDDSQEVLRKIDSLQKNPSRLKKLLYECGEELQCIVRERLVLEEDAPGYQTILEDFLFENETLLVPRGLRYKKLEYKDEKAQERVKPTLTEGRVFLTNTRLIFITAEQLKGTTVSTFGNARKGPGGYQVTSYHNNEIHYQQVPLHCIRSLEMHTRTGGRAELNIDTKLTCASGFLSKLSSALSLGTSCNKCGTSHREGEVSGSEYNERQLIMGVKMPPWMTKMMLIIHATSEVPLQVLTNFVSVLQRNASGITSCLGAEDDVTKAKEGTGEQRQKENSENLNEQLLEAPAGERRSEYISDLRDIVRTLGRNTLPERLPPEDMKRLDRRLQGLTSTKLPTKQQPDQQQQQQYSLHASQRLSRSDTLHGEGDVPPPSRQSSGPIGKSQRTSVTIERRMNPLTPKLSSVRGRKPDVVSREAEVASSTIPPPPMFSPATMMTTTTQSSVYEEPKSLGSILSASHANLSSNLTRNLSQSSQKKVSRNPIMRHFSDRSTTAQDISCGYYPDNTWPPVSSKPPEDDEDDDDDDNDDDEEDIMDDEHIDQLYTTGKPDYEAKTDEKSTKLTKVVEKPKSPISHIGQNFGVIEKVGSYGDLRDGSGGNNEGEVENMAKLDQIRRDKRRLLNILKDESELRDQNGMLEHSDVTIDPHAVTASQVEVTPKSRTVSPTGRHIRCACARCLTGVVGQSDMHCLRMRGKEGLSPGMKMAKDGNCVCAHCMKNQVGLIDSVLRDHMEQFDEISLV